MKIKPCPVGTLVSYAKVDGTCRLVENYRHDWCKDGTCGNCDMTRYEAGYRGKKYKLSNQGSNNE